jgi:multiple sugar transport system permease protein
MAIRRDSLVKTFVYLVLIGMSAFMVFPFVWMVVSSLKPFEEIFAGHHFLPEHWTLRNFSAFFHQTNAARALLNSTYIATAQTALSLFLCALGGYAFAKFRFFGRDVLFAFVIATLAVPFAVIVVPLFVMMRNDFHWVDTPWPLIVPWAANAFGIFFMRQYMLSIPDELIDAGRVDGASEIRIFLRIILPVARPALISLGIIVFIASWNNFLWPLVVAQNEETYTLPVALALYSVGQNSTQYGLLLAGATVVVLPILIVFLVFQRRFIEGIATTGIK